MDPFVYMLVLSIILLVYCSYETIQLYKVQAEVMEEHKKYQEEIREILKQCDEQ